MTTSFFLRESVIGWQGERRRKETDETTKYQTKELALAVGVDERRKALTSSALQIIFSVRSINSKESKS
jgi:hypothetical protein